MYLRLPVYQGGYPKEEIGMIQKMGIAVVVVVVVLVFLGLLVIGGVVYRQKAEAARAAEGALIESWSAATSTMETFATIIKERSLDFADFSSKAAESYIKLQGLEKSVGQLSVPGKYRTTKTELLSFLQGSEVLLEKVKSLCDTWRSANFRDLELKITVVTNAAEATFNSWPGGGRNLKQPSLKDWTAAPSVFNKMRSARSPETKVVSLPLPGILTSIPAGWTLVPTPSRPGIDLYYSPATADYVRSMQSLLRGYKQLRGDLEDYIAMAKKYGRVLDSAYTGQFDNAYASRTNVLQAMNSLSPPPEYASKHVQAVACVERGLRAMDALKAGDYQTFHEYSQTNTDALASVMQSFGISG